jgi:hypothetical protein
VDPAAITFLRDLSTPMFVELFEAGLGDAIVLDLTNAEALQAKGTGFIVDDYTETGGIGPNSVYYCRTDRFDELSDRLVHFASALQESMTLLKSVTAADLEPLLVQHWPTMPTATLIHACDRMLNSHTWDTVRIDRDGTDRWMRILHEERMVRTPPPFTALVDDTIVDRIASAPASAGSHP